MGDVANSADVERRLSAHDLGRVGSEASDVLVLLGSELFAEEVDFVDLFLGEPGDFLHDNLKNIKQILFFYKFGVI